MRKIAVLMAALGLAAVLNGCGSGLTQSQQVLEMEAEDVLVLSDGQAVDCWREYETFPDTDVHLPSGWVDYCLEDGTVLLQEQDLYPPALPETLPEQVRQSIQNHYARQGRRYSAESLLQGAYAEYKKDPAGFSPWMTRQNTWETALAERVVYVVTDVTLPLGGREQTSYPVGAAFDRTTGEKLSFWSLCAVPEAEAKEMLLGQVDPEDPRRAPMLEALTEDMVVIASDHYRISYPVGTLPGEELGTLLSGELPEGLLQPWAVPEAQS